jgi:hypothetical protein
MPRKGAIYHLLKNILPPISATHDMSAKIMRDGLERLGWTSAQLRRERKGHPAKDKLATRLRKETTMTWTGSAGNSMLVHGDRWRLAQMNETLQCSKPTPFRPLLGIIMLEQRRLMLKSGIGCGGMSLGENRMTASPRHH